MQDFQQRKKIRKILYSRNAVIALAIVTVFLLKGVVGVIQKDIESRRNVAITESELKTAQARNEELTKNIELLSTQAGVESEIRQKFSVSKEGEEVAVIVDTPKASSTNTEKKRGFWATLFDFFAHIL